MNNPETKELPKFELESPNNKGPLRLVGTLGYLVQNDSLLLLHRSRPPNKDLWSPPGGKAEIGESPEECMKREFEEETGFRPVEIELAGILTQYCRGHYDILMFLFRITKVEGKLCEGDGGPLKWVPLKDVYDLPVPIADKVFGPWVLDGSTRFFRARFLQTPGGEILEKEIYQLDKRA